MINPEAPSEDNSPRLREVVIVANEHNVIRPLPVTRVLTDLATLLVAGNE